jgi:DNA-directed RNA polymerase subunit RPC12/RpoP
MGNRYAAGKHAIAECDRCGQRFKLSLLKTEIIKTKKYDLLVCPECWDSDHPQLQLGMYPVDDPQALRNPRPDRSYVVSGLLADGYSGGGSRIFQWGWNPVGGSSASDAYLTPNVLAMAVQIGTVTVVTT